MLTGMPLQGLGVQDPRTQLEWGIVRGLARRAIKAVAETERRPTRDKREITTHQRLVVREREVVC